MTLVIKCVVKQPFHEHGFWWWWDETSNDWFVGCAPGIGIPNWAIKKKIETAYPAAAQASQR